MHQAFNGDVLIINLSADRINALAKIVRWDVGRHTDGNPCATVNRKLGKEAGNTTGSVSSRRSWGRNPPYPFR